MFTTPALVSCGLVHRAPSQEGETETSGTALADSTGSGESGGDSSGPAPHPPTQNKADILFVIDNSGSMGSPQHRLVPAIAPLLETLDAAGTDYRLGFTTTDTGNTACGDTIPEYGSLQITPCTLRLAEFTGVGLEPKEGEPFCTDNCALTELDLQRTTVVGDAEARVRPWLEPANLSEDLSIRDAVGCVLPQGIRGCGFESPLESMYQALARFDDPADPAFGFRRDDSVFTVIFLTDEADCSHDPDSVAAFLSEGNRHFWSDPDSPFPTSAVCWSAGVQCTGGPSPYDTCEPVNLDIDGNPAESEGAVLHPLSRYLNRLANLPQPTLVAGLVGVPPGYMDGASITYADSSDERTQLDFGIGPACMAGGSMAIPAVRLRELQDRHVGERLFGSICASDHEPAMTRIGAAIVDRIFEP